MWATCAEESQDTCISLYGPDHDASDPVPFLVLHLFILILLLNYYYISTQLTDWQAVVHNLTGERGFLLKRLCIGGLVVYLCELGRKHSPSVLVESAKEK